MERYSMDHGEIVASSTTLPLRAMSSWVLSSSEDGDSTISLCSFFLCLTTLTVNKILLKCYFLCFYLFPMPLVLSLGTKQKSLALLLLLSSQTALSMSWCMGLFLPRDSKTLHFPLLNFIKFLSSHFSSLVRSLWMTADSSVLSSTPPSLVPSAEFG